MITKCVKCEEAKSWK